MALFASFAVQLISRFNLLNSPYSTHPRIQVESLYVGQSDQQMPKILAAVVGNAPPDMLWYGPMIAGQLVELGAIRPLDDWLPKVRDKINPALLESMEYQGHFWSARIYESGLSLKPLPIGKKPC